MADLEELIPERYRVAYNQSNNSFKILDTWHSSIKNLNLETNPEIPDDSPALKTLSTEEVNALVGELIKLGWLDKMISAKASQAQVAVKESRRPSIAELVVEKIAAVTIDDSNKSEPHTAAVKEAIIALREIATKL